MSCVTLLEPLPRPLLPSPSKPLHLQGILHHKQMLAVPHNKIFVEEVLLGYGGGHAGGLLRLPHPKRTLPIQNNHMLLNQSALAEGEQQVVGLAAEGLLEVDAHIVTAFDELRLLGILALQKIELVLEGFFGMLLLFDMGVHHHQDFVVDGDGLFLIKPPKMRRPQLQMHRNNPQIIPEHGRRYHFENLRVAIRFHHFDHLSHRLHLHWLHRHIHRPALPRQRHVTLVNQMGYCADLGHFDGHLLAILVLELPCQELLDRPFGDGEEHEEGFKINNGIFKIKI